MSAPSECKSSHPAFAKHIYLTDIKSFFIHGTTRALAKADLLILKLRATYLVSTKAAHVSEPANPLNHKLLSNFKLPETR